ncbi:MAG TPA: hypothetical protein P5556_03190 [Candidatus Gastranaerophilales bacterium]|nr:hypothetical protein [Candidatus Gastranaerophilales bacterium]
MSSSLAAQGNLSKTSNFYFGSKNSEEKTEKKSPIKGAIALGTSGIIAGKGINSGLPRLFGIRIERHYTSKENARKIINSGKFLLPRYGGTGASKAINNAEFIDASKGWVHITGIHKDSIICKIMPDKFKNSGCLDCLRTFQRKAQGFIYKGVIGKDLHPAEVFEDFFSGKITGKEAFKNFQGVIFDGLTGRNAKTFYIPGTDEYFNKKFVPDCHDLALKTKNKVRVYTNRLSAMVAGLKEHGLRGIKGNKARATAGGIILGATGTISFFSAKYGINNLS